MPNSKDKQVDSAEDVPQGKSRTGYVQYIGLSTSRGITREDWEAAGVTDQGDVWWSSGNGYRVPREELSDRAYEVGIRPDRFLVLIGGSSEEGALEEHPLAESPPAAEQTPMPDPVHYAR